MLSTIGTKISSEKWLIFYCYYYYINLSSSESESTRSDMGMKRNKLCCQWFRAVAVDVGLVLAVDNSAIRLAAVLRFSLFAGDPSTSWRSSSANNCSSDTIRFGLDSWSGGGLVGEKPSAPDLARQSTHELPRSFPVCARTHCQWIIFASMPLVAEYPSSNSACALRSSLSVLRMR